MGRCNFLIECVSAMVSNYTPNTLFGRLTPNHYELSINLKMLTKDDNKWKIDSIIVFLRIQNRLHLAAI